MENSHSKSAIFYATAIAFERASYYGVRAILFLFLFNENSDLDTTETIVLFGWLSIILYTSKFLGALLGDLVFGNKKTVLVGVIIQIVGYGILCLQSQQLVYIGWGTVLFGSGLFTSNMIAEFGKNYLNMPRLLDAGFTMYYTSLNIGAALGILIIGHLADINFIYAFTAPVLLMLMVLALSRFASKEVENWKDNHTFNVNLVSKKRIPYMILAIVLTGFFWIIYQLSFNNMQNVQRTIFADIELIPKSILESGLNNFVSIVAMIILVWVWTRVYTNPFFKLFLGLTLTALSLTLLLFIPETSSAVSISLYSLAMVFLALGESLISPMLHSIVTRFSKPKYLAITLIVVAIPGMLFNSVSSFLSSFVNELKPEYIFLGGTFILLAVGAVAYNISKTYKDDGIYLSKEVKEFLS